MSQQRKKESFFKSNHYLTKTMTDWPIVKNKSPIHSNSYTNIYSQKKKSKHDLTWYQNILVGFAAGGTEVLIDHPLWTIKTRIQTGQQPAWIFNPKILYSGVALNICSMAPITAVQFGLSHLFNQMMSENIQKSSYGQLISAFMGGAGSAMFSCPAEMIMAYQGKINKINAMNNIERINFIQATQQIIQQYGRTAILRGLPSTGMREAIFTDCFMEITPLFKSYIKNHIDNDFFSTLFAGLGSGIIATMTSHPFDTIKTIQQNAETVKPLSFTKACQHIYSKGGIYGFFDGAKPRGLRVIAAITIISFIREKLSALIQEYKDHAADYNDNCSKPNF